MSASLQQGLDRFREVLDTPVASFFSSCVHCGLCAEACLFYTETNDPRYTPIHKLEPLRRLWEREFTLTGRLAALVGLAPPLDDGVLEAWSPLAYDGCTLCGRCSLACPLGLDVSGMIRRMREGMAVSGHAPDGLVEATRRTMTIGSPMGVTLATLKAQIAHQEKEGGLPIPLDQPGAEYLMLLSSQEIVSFPEILPAIARIFRRAHATWTLSSDAFEATNTGIQIGVSDIARQIVQRIVEAAVKLGVKTVISPECGHAYTALRFEGPNLTGRPHPFQVLHILEVLERFRREGRLPLKERDRDSRPLSYHDPCQIARKGGVVEEPRLLLRKIASEFREMEDHGRLNWCCGGGGGVSAIERAEPLRARVFQRKKRQLEALGVHTLVTACANCRMIIEEDLEKYDMEVEVVGLTELVADHLEEEEETGVE